MLNIPPLRFDLQDDSATPLPNLDLALVNTDCVKLSSIFAYVKGDFINCYLRSTVPGGVHNQSFRIEKDTPLLNLVMPKGPVEANEGNTVTLQLYVTRDGAQYPAPNAQVTINRRPIVIPTPGTVWDLTNGNPQGWVAQGGYVGGKLSFKPNEGMVINLKDSMPGKSHIITRAVPVIAGTTYDCHFEVSGDTQDPSVLYMTINGAPIGPPVRNFLTGFLQIGAGIYTVKTTGSVHFGILNDAVPSGFHRLTVSRIVMTPKP